MKLLSQVSRVYGKTKYEKFWVVIPQKVLDILKWKKGDELDTEITRDNKLIIKKKK